MADGIVSIDIPLIELGERDGGGYLAAAPGAVTRAVIERSGQYWTAEVSWSIWGERPEPATILLAASGEPLTGHAIRQLPLGEIISASRRALTEEARRRWDKPTGRKRLGKLAAENVSKLQASKPVRGKRLTDADLANVAAVYRAAWMAGGAPTGHPMNEAVREAFFLSQAGAAKRIAAARKAGLLDGVGRTHR